MKPYVATLATILALSGCRSLPVEPQDVRPEPVPLQKIEPSPVKYATLDALVKHDRFGKQLYVEAEDALLTVYSEMIQKAPKGNDEVSLAFARTYPKFASIARVLNAYAAGKTRAGWQDIASRLQQPSDEASVLYVELNVLRISQRAFENVFSRMENGPLELSMVRSLVQRKFAAALIEAGYLSSRSFPPILLEEGASKPYEVDTPELNLTPLIIEDVKPPKK